MEKWPRFESWPGTDCVLGQSTLLYSDRAILCSLQMGTGEFNAWWAPCDGLASHLGRGGGGSEILNDHTPSKPAHPRLSVCGAVRMKKKVSARTRGIRGKKPRAFLAPSPSHFFHRFFALAPQYWTNAYKRPSTCTILTLSPGQYGTLSRHLWWTLILQALHRAPCRINPANERRQWIREKS